MNTEEPHIDVDIARSLVRSQFPRWADLSVAPVQSEGWCNQTFHLGDRMVIRLPRHVAYTEQVRKEADWLPRLAPLLPFSVPEPLAVGAPSEHYPWHWSVYNWIEGETARPERIACMSAFAADLAEFLSALQAISPLEGPGPGQHNFYRGGALTAYDTQTREAISALGARVDAAAALTVWERATASSWLEPPVWIHGDVSVGNLLVSGGRLNAVIDFGNLAVGDPACDLAMYWTVFDEAAKRSFRNGLLLGRETWARGRGWVLWKALILAAGFTSSNAYEASQPWGIIEEVLSDHRADA
jgi:aminoglycoside phosphotransferase (APT) family kinase protein